MATSDPTASPRLVPFAIRALSAGDRTTRVVVEGEIDLLTSAQLKTALEQELAAADSMLLDLSRVQFIDSSGLQAILGAVQGQGSDGSKLKISSSLPAQAHRLFELVGVLEQLPLVDH